jgi:hypothetical protein
MWASPRFHLPSYFMLFDSGFLARADFLARLYTCGVAVVTKNPDVTKKKVWSSIAWRDSR